MAHTSTTIYRNTSTTPYQGVCIADIQVVLGSSRNDIGGLITYGNINKWAKCKPIRSQLLGILSAQDQQLANYGIDIPVAGYSSLPAVVSAISGGYSWDYLRPRGISVTPYEWFRFLDFNGYDHLAPAPLEFSQNTQKTVYDGVSTTSVTVGFAKTQESDPDSITLGVLHPNNNATAFSSMYFGILLYCDSPSLYFAKTQDTTFSNIGSLTDAIVEITDVACPNAGTRVYTAIPFFSTQPITTTATGSTSLVGTLYPIPLATCSVSITQEAVTTMTNVFSYTNVGQTSPLYYRLNINTNTNIYGVQYSIIACKTSSGTSSSDDVVLATGTISSSDIGNIYIPGETTWNSVNNTSFNPMVTEENGYSYIRCEMRRGEVAVGTHSVLSISWGTGPTPWEDI